MWSSSPWPTAVVQIAGFATAAFLLVFWMRGQTDLNVRRLLIPLGLMASWPLFQLSTGLTVYAWRTWQAALYWASCLTWFFIALQLCADARNAGRFLRILALSGYAIALAALLQHYTAPGRVFWIFTLPQGSTSMGPFLYANHYAAFLEIFLPLALYASLTDVQYQRWHIAGSALLYTSVVGAASRAGFAVATAAVLVTVAQLLARSIAAPRVTRRIFFRTAVVAAILIAAMGPAALIQKFSATDPYSTRREYLRSTVAMVRDHPLAGVGMGNWATVYPGYARFDDGAYVSQARNDWAQWTAEGGLPFLAFMVWFALGIFQGAHRTIWGYGLAAIYLHSWVDYLIERNAMAILFFAIAGAVAASKSPPQWE
jgi:hypothetical protein